VNTFSDRETDMDDSMPFGHSGTLLMLKKQSIEDDDNIYGDFENQGMLGFNKSPDFINVEE
jgi:hypothetical protein